MKYFIVWNSDRTEGFMSIDKGAQDTAMTNKADRSRGYPSRSTAAAAFFEAYRDESKSRDTAELPAQDSNSHASLIEERDRLRAALDTVMTGGNHLASQLISRVGADFAERFPEDEFPELVLRRLGATVEYDMWCAWSAIMKARAALHPDQEKEG